MIKQVAIAVALLIKEYRTVSKMSQKELAARAGLSRHYLGDLEKGNANTTLKTLARLLDALDVKFLDFLNDLGVRLVRWGSEDAGD